MIAIKELTKLEEMEQVQKLEADIWQSTPLPTHQTLTVAKHGGILVGAYDEDRLVGFSYGFPAVKNGKTYLCSHMLGIDGAYRSQQIGEKLKFAQREVAITKGYDLMVWTYDPLETRNGYLNLTKLNGICDTYIENCYGEMQDGFNKGLPSDRFEVHWHLTSQYVTEQLHPNTANPKPLAQLTFDTDQLPLLKDVHLDNLEEAVYSLPVPKDFQSLKAQNQEKAMQWRFATRDAFEKLFAAGYAAVRLEQQELCNHYIFVKKASLPLEETNHENN